MRLDWYKTLPEGYKAMLDLQQVVDKSNIDHKLLELIKIRASQINGCAHCLEMHTKDALALGEMTREFITICLARSSFLF